MRSSSDARFVVPALAAVYVIWGSTYLAMRVTVEAVPPFMMASVRFILVGAVLLAILRARGAPWPTLREWAWSIPVGSLMFVLGNGTVALAEKHISSGIAAVVCGTMPLWAAAMGPLFGERTAKREWAGMALGLLGVVALAGGKELRAEPVSALILMIAPISWAAGSLLARKLPLPKGLMSAATQMMTGGAVMGVVSLLAQERVPETIPPVALWSWIYLCTFGSLVAYSAYTYLLRETRPAVATSYSYVNPVIAVVMGALLGNETIGVEVIVSVVLIVAATALVVLGRATSAPPVQTQPAE